MEIGAIVNDSGAITVHFGAIPLIGAIMNDFGAINLESHMIIR